METSHEELYYNFLKKEKYEKMKENVRNISEKLKQKTETTRLNNVKAKEIPSYYTSKNKNDK